jgi:hypothetical protein
MGDVHLKEIATSRRISPFVILPLDISWVQGMTIDFILLYTSDQTVVWKKKVPVLFPTTFH